VRVTLTSAVLGFAVIAAALTVTPGLDTALVLRASLTGSRREALATGAGIVLGLLVWGCAAAVGVSALLAASTDGYDVLRYAGAAYLLWFGARLVVRAVGGRGAMTDAPAVGRSPWAAVRLGLVTNLLNPKVGVFYVALLPQFVPPGSDPLSTGLLLAAVHGLLSMAWFTLLAVLAGTLQRWLRRPAAVRTIDGVTGVALLGFGARLALAGR
jgi:threonine/homoserine/homoserine lactone efflux protein